MGVVTEEWAPEDFEFEGTPRRRGVGVRVIAGLVLLALVAGVSVGVLRLLFT